MKNLLLLLVLANILYFVWGFLAEEKQLPGTEIVPASGEGPTLAIIPARAGGEKTEAGAESGYSKILDLESLTGPACVTLGPFKELAEAESAAEPNTNSGIQTRIRSVEAEIFVGHWVQIRNVTDDATADNMLKTLSEGGLNEAYLVRTDDEGLKISLGLFSDMDRAEKTELKARGLGLPADISPRMAERIVHFVDMRLPSGRGAGAIVEEYGEELVLLRDGATCPN